MTQRDKLIGLLTNCYSGFTSEFLEKTANSLITNGVIVLPCKVGDKVWYITGMGHNLIKPAMVKEIIMDSKGIKNLYVCGDGYNFENSFDIFYLTRKEAEKALAERKEKESNE